MRVRGYWTLRENRPISLPIPWPNWDPRDGGDDDHSDDDSDDDADHNKNPDKANYDHPVSSCTTTSFGQQPPTNPFSNPTELQAMKDSFSKQPHWKPAVIEGETREGTAEENVNKWRGLMGHHE